MHPVQAQARPRNGTLQRFIRRAPIGGGEPLHIAGQILGAAAHAAKHLREPGGLLAHINELLHRVGRRPHRADDDGRGRRPARKAAHVLQQVRREERAPTPRILPIVGVARVVGIELGHQGRLGSLAFDRRRRPQGSGFLLVLDPLFVGEPRVAGEPFQLPGMSIQRDRLALQPLRHIGPPQLRLLDAGAQFPPRLGQPFHDLRPLLRLLGHVGVCLPLVLRGLRRQPLLQILVHLPL